MKKTTNNWHMWVLGALTIIFPGLVFFGLATVDQVDQVKLLVELGITDMTGLNLATLGAFLIMLSGIMMVFAKTPKTVAEGIENVSKGWMTTALSVVTLTLMALVMFGIIDPSTKEAVLIIVNDTFAGIVSGDLLATLAVIIGGVGQIIMIFVKDKE